MDLKHISSDAWLEFAERYLDAEAFLSHHSLLGEFEDLKDKSFHRPLNSHERIRFLVLKLLFDSMEKNKHDLERPAQS